MTCIVGLEQNGKVYIGADSAAATNWEIYQTRLNKVFRCGGFLIGYTTSFRMGQLLQYKLDVEPQGEGIGDLEFMATIFVDAVRKCLSDGGFTKVENSQEEGGSFLVGYKGNLYAIDSDFQVNTYRDGYHAVGCGAKFALGNMHGTKGKKAKRRIKNALMAAGHFSNGVCEPYFIEAI